MLAFYASASPHPKNCTQMAHGGTRQGAGRKPGAKNKATLGREADTQALVERVHEFARADGLTLEQVAAMSPIDVMHHAMLLQAMAQNWTAAAAIAKEIAPYRFAKLTSSKIDATVRRSLDEMSYDELIEIAGECEDIIGREGEDSDDTGGEE